jgi:hypothetical protein
VTRSRRQPGSAFKPFVYAATLERGSSPVSVLPNLSALEPAARVRPPQSFLVPPGLVPPELCRISYELPVEACPTYVEYFKAGDALPSQICTAHDGAWNERFSGAVGGFCRGFANRFKGIFR